MLLQCPCITIHLFISELMHFCYVWMCTCVHVFVYMCTFSEKKKKIGKWPLLK